MLVVSKSTLGDIVPPELAPPHCRNLESYSRLNPVYCSASLFMQDEYVLPVHKRAPQHPKRRHQKAALINFKVNYLPSVQLWYKIHFSQFSLRLCETGLVVLWLNLGSDLWGQRWQRGGSRALCCGKAATGDSSWPWC